jgi:hypothetical protein
MGKLISGIILVGLVSFSGLSTAYASSGQTEDGWRFSLTPYIWLPTIGGQLKFTIPPGSGGSPIIDAGPNDYLENLDFVILLTGEARKGRWSILGDFVYLDFAGSDAKTVGVELPGGGTLPVIDAGTETDLTGSLLTFAPGYSLYSTGVANMDFFGGVRYLSIEAGADWHITGPAGEFPARGSLREDAEILDGILGVRGRAKLGEGNWSITYYLDVGTGDSDWSWQASTGLSYGFSWGDLRLAYRHLDYDTGSDHLLKDFSFSGPALGATFHF